jgi:hypothetical protein
MVLIGLIVLILIAKEILVFNAETLVLITFVLFISMLFSLSDNVVELFNSRVDSLKKEFFSQRALRIVYLENASKYLELKKEVVLIVKKYLKFYVLLKHTVLKQAHLSLQIKVYNNTLEKLKRISALEKKAYASMLLEINKVLPVLVKKEFLTNASARDAVLTKSITVLTTTSGSTK